MNLFKFRGGMYLKASSKLPSDGNVAIAAKLEDAIELGKAYAAEFASLSKSDRGGNACSGCVRDFVAMCPEVHWYFVEFSGQSFIAFSGVGAGRPRRMRCARFICRPLSRDRVSQSFFDRGQATV